MRRGPGTSSPFTAHHRPESLPRGTRILVLGLAAVLVALWGWLRNADSRALAGMDPELRRELFQRSRAETEALCARPELVDECRARAEFLERFPECDASCRDLVARQLRRPTR